MGDYEMRYYKNGGGVTATTGTLDLPEITKEEYEERQKAAEARLKAYEPIAEASRPLTESEIFRMDMRQRVNSLGIDNATAGRMTAYFPAMDEVCAAGELIKAGTRIRDDANPEIIWRASVDLWNSAENAPENAPTLWERVAYRSGIRIAPEVFTATSAAKNGELMWFGDTLYRSLMDGNVFTPQEENCWERAE